MAARTDLEIVRLVRGTYAPTAREKGLCWLCAAAFLLLALPLSLLLAAGEYPPRSGHLPTALL